MNHVQTDQFLLPCSPKLALEPPMAPQLHREATWTWNLWSQLAPTPYKHISSASKTRPSQGHQCLSTSEPLCKGKTLTPASKEAESCKQLYNNIHSCHLKSYCQKPFKQKSEHNTHPCKSAANKQFWSHLWSMKQRPMHVVTKIQQGRPPNSSNSSNRSCTAEQHKGEKNTPNNETSANSWPNNIQQNKLVKYTPAHIFSQGRVGGNPS